MASSFKRILYVSTGFSSSFLAVNFGNKLLKEDDEEKFRPWPFRPFEALQAAINKSFGSDAEDQNSLKLEQVHVITRHGARTPFKGIPNVELVTWKESDTFDLPETMIDFCVRTKDGGDQPESAIDNAYLNRDRLKGGSLVGQLTKVGQNQMFELGKSLKAKYIDEMGFLPSVFSNEDVYVRTTNIVRTVKSARCVLAGMYGEQSGNDKITMVTSANQHEFMYPNYYFCKSLKDWAEIAWASSTVVPGLREFYSILGQKLGLGENTEELGIISMQDNLRARLAHDHPVPDFIKERLDEIDQFAVQVQMRVITGTEQNHEKITRFAVGNFLETICKHLEDKVQDMSNYKFMLYSSHDTTLMALLYAFGVRIETWPRFAADLKIELYSKSEGGWFVKLLYNDKEETMPGCESTLCPLKKFLENVESFRVKDWQAECGVSDDYKGEPLSIKAV